MIAQIALADLINSGPTADHYAPSTPAGSKTQTVIAAAILWQLHAIITTGQAWDPVTAAHGTRRARTPLAA